MRAIRTASAALLATAAVALSAPAASAAPAAPAEDGTGRNITSFGFSVTPRTVAPGGTVTLTSDGCEVPSVTVTSGVFDTVTLTEGRPGSATVDADARIGAEYEIAFDCKGERGTTTLTVAPAHTTPPTPPAPLTPHKGVKAGFGGSAGSDALGAAELTAGAALIAGALGTAVVLTRRRAGGRP
ncbi:plastocyanin [Streptomyces filamentosus]